MMAKTSNSSDQRHDLTSQEVKQQAEGHWLKILEAAGLPHEVLDGRGHPCPKCGGTDRFTVFADVEETGGLMCRQCFSKENGDGLAAVKWFRGCSFSESLAFVAECMGIQPTNSVASGKRSTSETIVADVARAKRMPLDAFREFGANPERRGKAVVARVPVYNEQGEVHSYLDLTPDGKGWFKRGKGSAGLCFPGRLPKAGETWLVAEGVKDATALVGLGYLAAGLPRNEMASKYAGLFGGCHVVVIPDLDVPGMGGAKRTASRLAGVAASVQIARLPGEIVQSGGQDVRDVLRIHGADVLKTAIEEATPWEPSDGGPEDDRSEVLITLNEAVVADQVVEALGRLGSATPSLPAGDAERVALFQRGGVLVHVVADAAASSVRNSLSESELRIRPIPKAIVRERITQSVRLVEEVQREENLDRKQRRPPEWLVQAVHQRGDYGDLIRPLSGITRTPILRPDGSVIQTSGWDQQTGMLYRPDRPFPRVADNPTQAEAAKAALELLETLSDFPFGSDADCSIWLSLVLTLLARSAIDGPCPLFVFDANTRGAGKSLLADVAGIVTHGHAMARKTWPTKDEEVRKTITAVALESWPAILLDNVATTLGGPSLDAALTGTSWQDRILGESRSTGLLPLTTVWIGTGNNVELSADTARRTLLARLESLDEHPEDRTEFRHSDLKVWTSENRHRLAVAGLTMLRAFFVAGCPDGGLRPWGSFEEWSRIIRGTLIFAGLPDPCANRDVVRDADRSAEVLRLIHAGIDEADVSGNGVTTAEMASMLSHSVGPDAVDGCPTLRVAIAELCGSKIDSRRMGYGLRRYRGRVCAGRRLECRTGHGGVKRWFIERLRSVPVPLRAAGDRVATGPEVEVF